MLRLLFYFFSFSSLFITQALGSEPHHFFEQNIRPILHNNCIKCHGPDQQKGGLRLDHIDFIKMGGTHGEVINFNDLINSKLITAIEYKNNDLQMPPGKAGGQLSPEKINHLKQWIINGLYWPKDDVVDTSKFIPGKIREEDRQWWAFQDFQHATPPADKSQWAINPIDQFIEHKLKEKKLKPATRASKRDLIRRVTYDLHGLPPTPEQVEDFINDKSEDAYERLVDRLLNSPRYGERWAQHWLDVVRYSESDGYRADHFRPHAYKYRDYVVTSLNQDKPYDQFVREQIAGDEIDPGNPDALNATMYLRHWIYEYNQRDVMTQWDIILNDITETTADTFMGMSVACAKCHNHKFDPILQKDYYRLQAFFKAILPREDMPVGSLEKKQAYHSKNKIWLTKTQKLRHQIHDIEYPVLLKHAKGQGFSKFIEPIQKMMLKHPEDRSSYEQQIAQMAMRQLKINKEDTSKVPLDQQPILKNLKAQLKQYNHLKPKPLTKMPFLVSDAGTVAPPNHIPDSKDKENILPGYLNIFDPNPAQIQQVDPALNSTGRRTTLANWIASKNNPLTARVMVNRLWQRHFGRGIVATPNNFGRLGELPTHPKLLDWLAKVFVDGDWKIKRMHRLICTSATYCQSSKVELSEHIKREDPNNHYLWRFPPQRLDAEQIRDSILSISHSLDTSSIGGKSIKGSEKRRSLYVQKKRNSPDLLLKRFNAPEGFKSTPTRNMTNTPLQSLLLLNSNWPLEQAKTMATKILKQYQKDREQIERIFAMTLSREPTKAELESSLKFITEQKQTHEEHEQHLALVDFCHVMINSNEFIHLH